MLDIQNELKHYWTNDFGSNKLPIDDISSILEEFNSIIRKIGKDQYALTSHVEELLEVLDGNNQEEEERRRYRMDIRSKEEENNGLLQTLLFSLEQFEHLYRYIMKNEEEQWKVQISKLWEKMLHQLNRQGIFVTEGIGAVAEPKQHNVVQAVAIDGYEDSQILEVLQNGYIYRGNIVKKADVVICKKEEIVNE